jgi:hypothetical protein
MRFIIVTYVLSCLFSPVLYSAKIIRCEIGFNGIYGGKPSFYLEIDPELGYLTQINNMHGEMTDKLFITNNQKSEAIISCGGYNFVIETSIKSHRMCGVDIKYTLVQAIIEYDDPETKKGVIAVSRIADTFPNFNPAMSLYINGIEANLRCDILTEDT